MSATLFTQSFNCHAVCFASIRFSSNNSYNHSWFIIEKSCALPSSEAIFDEIMGKVSQPFRCLNGLKV